MILRLNIPAVLRNSLVLSGFLLTGVAATGSLPDDVIPFRLPDTEKIEAISSLIARGEGDWNSVNRGYAGDTPGGMEQLFGKPCQDFSVQQVLNLQNSGHIYAVGRYQFIPSTLRYAVQASGVDLEASFGEETQDQLLLALLKYKRPAIWAYLTGVGSLNHALDALAREWASIATSGRRSYYQGVGGNGAHVTREEAAAALEAARMLF